MAGIQAGFAQRVYVQYDAATPQAAYASKQLKEALLAQKYTVLNDQKGSDFLIRLGVDTARLESEAFNIVPEQNSIIIMGGDNRGMIYGSLSLAESIQHGMRLKQVQKRSEKPHYPFRAIKHNTPWYSYRSSSALDQHYETVRDVRYWEAFLDMMAENRFNSLSLWNLHPFVYMISPKNFLEASPFSETEMKEWQQLHQEIFRMAHERDIDTYIIPFNIFVSPEFAEAYGVAHENVYPNYYVSGDTSEIVKRYMRESITQMFQEYPTLTGLGLTLGEGIAGMTPQQRED
ncbi:hypothetical protein [Pontibacter harenae]|uniref:hypothetical protein n=1 Tax=Pontibacter harenae TaxID=2894083 RepID=UPI0034E20FB6